MSSLALFQDQQYFGSGIDRLQDIAIRKDLAAHELQEIKCRCPGEGMKVYFHFTSAEIMNFFG